MQIKHTLLALLCFSFSFSYGQMPTLVNKVSDVEKEMKFYNKYPAAEAVVLHERGDNYFTQRKKGYGAGIYLISQYYNKTKIFKKEAFNLASIKLTLYGNEKIENLEAFTHNGNTKHQLLHSEIIIEKVNKFESTHIFSFSNIKEGSIIEYQYDKVTPYYKNLSRWNFQSTIPKIHSEFNAKIPGHLKYNRVFFGEQKLDVNSSEIEKHCFKASFLQTDCETLKYSMKDVPPFTIEPEYMLSHYNYISRLEFELAEVNYNQHGRSKISTTWEEIDRNFMRTEGIGPQLLQNGFFRRKVPEGLLQGDDKLSRAKKIFEYVKNYYAWDTSYGSYQFNDVREAFKSKKGSVAEINMTLINLLNEAGIRTTLMLSSTRQNGLPKKSHPSVTDFNYFLARFAMNGKIYLLDASDKDMPFGMIPFRALNNYGRVMDFERKSYWSEIKPNSNNTKQIRSQIIFNPSKNILTGTLNVSNFGYEAIKTKRELRNLDEEEYLNSFEKKLQNNAKIINYEINKERNTESKLFQRFDYELQITEQNGKFYFNPIVVKLIETNPFVLENRTYPIDYGYQRTYKYSINMTIPVGYAIEDLPKNKAIQLGDKIVFLKFSSQQDKTQININYELAINNTSIAPNNYQSLKDIYRQIIDIQENTTLVFTKIE